MLGDGSIRSRERSHEGAIDRVPLGDKTPFRSAGRRAPAFKEPEQLPGPDEPVSRKEGR